MTAWVALGPSGSWQGASRNQGWECKVHQSLTQKMIVIRRTPRRVSERRQGRLRVPRPLTLSEVRISNRTNIGGEAAGMSRQSDELSGREHHGPSGARGRTWSSSAETSLEEPKSRVTHSFESDDASHTVCAFPSAAKVALCPLLEDSATITLGLALQDEAASTGFREVRSSKHVTLEYRPQEQNRAANYSGVSMRSRDNKRFGPRTDIRDGRQLCNDSTDLGAQW